MKLLIVLTGTDTVARINLSTVTEVVVISSDSNAYEDYTVEQCSHLMLSFYLSMMDKLLGLTLINVSGLQLPSGMTSLECLQCDNNNLTSLPHGMTSLIALFCSHNLLTSLPSTMPNLKILFCDNNRLVSLDLLSFPELSIVKCSDNLLTHIFIDGESKLKILNCKNNRLNSLPRGMKSLLLLGCAHNMIEVLPPDIPERTIVKM